MRTYGRVAPDPLYPDRLEWRVVETDENGLNDMVYVTALCQVLKLNLGESPFWAQFGLPARDSVMQQFAPDLYVARTQRYFGPFFTALLVVKVEAADPTYRVAITTHNGVVLNRLVPVPK